MKYSCNVFVLSEAMSLLIKENTESTIQCTTLDLSTHFKFSNIEQSLCLQSKFHFKYDIGFIGSFSKTHTVTGFLRLLTAYSENISVLVSEPVYNAICHELSKFRLSIPSHVQFNVIPQLPQRQFDEVLSSCKVGFVSLKPCCAGTCFPSRIFNYLALWVPVLFDGPALR